MKKLFLFTALSFFAFGLYAQQYPEMIKVEGGTFTMGNNSSDGESDEQPAHSVTVNSFSIGKYEVTVAEYKAYCTATEHQMPEAPDWGWNDKHPMVNVTFDDANAYSNWLSKKTGKNWRLPTEAEWEYAARGGSKSGGYTYAGSDDIDEVGWYMENADWQTQACGRKNPNELGIYDMSGNVWEWCNDWYNENYYSESPATNPKGPSSGVDRVLRGGGWELSDYSCRVAGRNFEVPYLWGTYFGFRVVIPQ